LRHEISLDPRGVVYWFEDAVFGLDSWLRQRQGIFEYTDAEFCLFRIQHGTAEEAVSFSDGSRIVRGDHVLDLHLWNEHMPPMGHDGPTFRWARRLSRSFDLSLRELAHYIATQPGSDDVLALRGDLRFSDDGQDCQPDRIAGRYGFEAASRTLSSPSIHRIGENILMSLLAMATNPHSARRSIFRRSRQLVYLSRRSLIERYGRQVARRNIAVSS